MQLNYMLYLFESPIFKRAVVLIAIFHFVAILGYSLPLRLLRTDQDRDLVAYYLAIERMQNNEPLYINLPANSPHETTYPVYHYPPMLSSILAMMPAMSFMTFARGWLLLLYSAFWVYATCLAKIAVGRAGIKGILVAGLILSLFPGTHIALSLGQIDPLLWALFGVALTVPAVKGALLMAVTLVKPWAMWPLLWSIRDGSRVIINAFLVAIGWLVLGCLVRGADLFYTEWMTWFREILPSLGQGSWSPGNWSISFGALRAIKTLGLWDYTGGEFPVWARAWLLFCGLAVPMLSGYFLRKHDKILQLSAVGCLAVIFAPICWTTYLPILLTVVAVLIGQRMPTTRNITVSPNR